MMYPFKSSFRQSIHIWVICFLLFIASAVFLFIETKAVGYLTLVPYHHKWLDVFFTWFTYLGDGLFILLLAMFLIVRKIKWTGIAVIATYAISGILSQSVKYFFPSPRPAVFFREAGMDFYEIPGVTLMKSMASFPSGHTASAFALMATLVLCYPRSRWNLLWLLLAVLIGYSRMYLGNHFLLDVLCGAMLGVLSACICHMYVYRFAAKSKLPG